jgi:hypothetical protein
MLSLGLGAADLKLFHLGLCAHHSVKITMSILTLGHAYVGDLSAQLMDGQVTIDGDADVTRSLTCQLMDPDRVLQLDSTSPNDGALFFDRMIQVTYSVKSALLPRWVDVPIFTGPITKMSRTDEIINLEAMGKEKLVTPPTVAYYSKTWAKGLKRTAIATAIMHDYGGETKFTIPDWPNVVTTPVTMTSESNMWALVQKMIGGRVTRHCFYDGRGILVARDMPKSSSYTFTSGNGGNITSRPIVDYDGDNVINAVRVKGGDPKGKAKAPVVTILAPATHPLSPKALGRNGKSRVILEVVDDDTVKTAAAAKQLAQTHLDTVLKQSVDVKFDALVVPHLEPEDLYTLNTPEFSIQARARQFSIPLRSANMSVGTAKRVSVNRTGIRR